MDQVVEALMTSAGLLWKALWALIFGYTISAAIQVLVTREQMAKVLGERGVKQSGLASFFGFISSSFSFAALAAVRSVLTKGAHPVNAIAFLIASTNLVIELGIVLWKLLGNLMLGLFMIVYAYVITSLWFPSGLVDEAREQAEQQQAEEETSTSSLRDKVSRDRIISLEGWRAIADAFYMEWKMANNEILFGFTLAGFISVFVPQSVWNTLFLHSDSQTASLLVVL